MNLHKKVFTMKRSSQIHEALSIDQNMINYWLREKEHLPHDETSSDENDLLVRSFSDFINLLINSSGIKQGLDSLLSVKRQNF